MSTHDVTLSRSEKVAESTMAFRFTRPAGFTFKAGQAVDLVLPGIAGAEPERHAFSIASAPFEEELMVTTRMRSSSFKATLGAMQPGAAAQVEGPFGSLTLHRAPARDAVFIAGGIGITPFLSILRQAKQALDPRRFTLVYSNRRPEDAAFLAELQQLERDYPGFRLLGTMTEMPASAREWSGERRMVDSAMIREGSRELSAPVFYLAGPPAMVAAIRSTLAEAGIEEDDVRAEEFFGY